MRILSKLMTMATAVAITASLAACGGSDDDSDGSGSATGTLTITASPTVIIADGKDVTLFTVKSDNADITDKATIYINDQKQSGTSFTTTTPGAYKVYAAYNGKLTNQITIQAADASLGLNLPVDSKPNQYDKFYHNVLIVQGTGTWCTYCPYMIKALDSYFESGENKDHAILAAAHSGDEMSSNIASKVISYCGITGFPTCVFNLNKNVKAENYGSVALNSDKISSNVKLELQDDAACGIAVAAASNSNKIAVRAKVKIGQEGDYRIAAWVLEDGFQYSQTGATAVGLPSLLTHNDVLIASSVNSGQGDLLGLSSAHQAGETVDFYHEFDIKSAGITNVSNCHIVVYVTKAEGKSYYATNAVACELNKSIGFKYE